MRNRKEIIKKFQESDYLEIEECEIGAVLGL